MSYPVVPNGEAEIRALLLDLAARKEFRAFKLRSDEASSQTRWAGFHAGPAQLCLPGLRLNGAQLFVRNFENPDTNFTRLLINWQTGAGKSIAAIAIAHEFIRQFRVRALLGEFVPTVFVISFTARETIQEDMLRHPEFGFVSASEAEELRRMRAAAGAAGGASSEARQLSGFVGVLRRRITDRNRGGYYQFYGYKEFANRLFAVTRQGLARDFDVQVLYGRSDGEFGKLLADAVQQGDVIVNVDLLDQMRGGLLIADEIHNVYNILETNNYGIAIQYALDELGADAPRAVFMSATPMTGSVAEVVDLLNLLVPRALLPDGEPLTRGDFFTRSVVDADVVDAEVVDADVVDADADVVDADVVGADVVGADVVGAVVDADVVDASTARMSASSFVVSKLRPGALDRIAHLSAGRVSFLLDSDVGSYPRRDFVGEAVADIPYLRFTVCPMSPFHERTLAHEQRTSSRVKKAESAGLAANAYTLYDMAFPNPEFPPNAAYQPSSSNYGLYKSIETPIRLIQAPEDWRAAAGVIVERGAAAGVSTGTAVISGAFLAADTVHHYSTKIATIIKDVLAIVKGGPGKIMIYHHRVRMSGVLLFQEALRMNGFTDETSTATDTTICSICGVRRVAHAVHDSHEYAPARFVVAHSDVDRSVMNRSIAQFNAPTNALGYQYRVLIGSKIIREGLNFRAVRHQLVASLPTNFPTMVQVFGRVVRKGSHNELEEDQRNVSIKVYVTTRADGNPSPELQRYIDKGREYLVIQEVERALRKFAIDGFANYGRIRTALDAGSSGEIRPSLDSLPYVPVVGPNDAAALPMLTATFLAYGYGDREVATIAAICRVLFLARPVWTYLDLWAAIRAGAVRGVNYDPALFDEGSFALALDSLDQPAGVPPTLVAKVGRFYVAAMAAPDGRPLLDVETYIRHAAWSGPRRVTVRVATYLRNSRADHNFEVRLREYEREYLLPDSPSTPEMALVEYGAAFHYALIKRLIVSDEHVTVDDDRVRDVYRRFRLVITSADASPATAILRTSSHPDKLVGFVTHDAVSLYDHVNAHWYNEPHSNYDIGRRHHENDIVIGFVASLTPSGASDPFANANALARFKLRPPTHKIKRNSERRGDGRLLARGAVCETRPREELEAWVGRLRQEVAARGARVHVTRGGSEHVTRGVSEQVTRGGSALTLTTNLGYAAKYDKMIRKRYPSATDICDSLRLQLLALEEHARARHRDDDRHPLVVFV